MSNGMTIRDYLLLEQLKARGEKPEYVEDRLEKGRRKKAERIAAQEQRAVAARNREARHAPGSGAYKGDWKPSGTSVTVISNTGDIVKTENAKPKKMSNAEFENNRDHCEKKSDTECSGCKGFRRAAYEYFSGGKEGKHPSRDNHKCVNR